MHGLAVHDGKIIDWCNNKATTFEHSKQGVYHKHGMGSHKTELIRTPFKEISPEWLCEKAKNMATSFEHSRQGIHVAEHVYTKNGWVTMRHVEQHPIKLEVTQVHNRQIRTPEAQLEKERLQDLLDLAMIPFLQGPTLEMEPEWLAKIKDSTDFTIANFKDFMIRKTPIPYQTMVYYMLEDQVKWEKMWEVVMVINWLSESTGKFVTRSEDIQLQVVLCKLTFDNVQLQIILCNGLLGHDVCEWKNRGEVATSLIRMKKQLQVVHFFHKSFYTTVVRGGLIFNMRKRRLKTEKISLQSFAPREEEDNMCCDKMHKSSESNPLARHAMCSYSLVGGDPPSASDSEFSNFSCPVKSAKAKAKAKALYKLLNRTDVEFPGKLLKSPDEMKDTNDENWVFDNNNPFYVPARLSNKSSIACYETSTNCKRPIMSTESQCIRYTKDTIARNSLLITMNVVPAPEMQRNTYQLTVNAEVDVDHENKTASLWGPGSWFSTKNSRNSARVLENNMVLREAGQLNINTARRQSHDWKTFDNPRDFNLSRQLLTETYFQDGAYDRNDTEESKVPPEFHSGRTRRERETVLNPTLHWAMVQTRQFTLFPRMGRSYNEKLVNFLKKYNIFADNHSQNYYHGQPQFRSPQDIITVLENNLHHALQYGLCLGKKYSMAEVNLALISELFYALYAMIDYLMPDHLLTVTDNGYDACAYANYEQCGFILRLYQEIMAWQAKYLVYYFTVAYEDHMKGRFPTKRCNDGITRFKKTRPTTTATTTTTTTTTTIAHTEIDISTNTTTTTVKMTRKCLPEEIVTPFVTDVYLRNFYYVDDENEKDSNTVQYNLEDLALFPCVDINMRLTESLWKYILSFINPLDALTNLFDTQTRYMHAARRYDRMRHLLSLPEGDIDERWYIQLDNSIDAVRKEYDAVGDQLKECRVQVRKLSKFYPLVESVQNPNDEFKRKVIGVTPIDVVSSQMRKAFKNNKLHQEEEGECYDHTYRQVPSYESDCQCAKLNAENEAKHQQQMEAHRDIMKRREARITKLLLRRTAATKRKADGVQRKSGCTCNGASSALKSFCSECGFGMDHSQSEPQHPVKKPNHNCQRCKPKILQFSARSASFVSKRPHKRRYMPSYLR